MAKNNKENFSQACRQTVWNTLYNQHEYYIEKQTSNRNTIPAASKILLRWPVNKMNYYRLYCSKAFIQKKNI
jgi:hypothetical protein